MSCHLSTKRRHRKTWGRGDCLQSLSWECIWKVTCLFISPLITEVSLREILCRHFFARTYDEKTTPNSTEMLDFELETMKEWKFWICLFEEVVSVFYTYKGKWTKHLIIRRADRGSPSLCSPRISNSSFIYLVELCLSDPLGIMFSPVISFGHFQAEALRNGWPFSIAWYFFPLSLHILI